MDKITPKEIIEEVAKKYNLTSEIPDFSDPKVVKQINARVLNEAFKILLVAAEPNLERRKKRKKETESSHKGLPILW